MIAVAVFLAVSKGSVHPGWTVDIAAACVGVEEATFGVASCFDAWVAAVVNLSSRGPVVEVDVEKTMVSAWLAAAS